MTDGSGGWNRDTFVGILGAAVLVAAMGGVFLYERSQFRSYDVAWSTSETGSTSFRGNLSEGEPVRFEVELGQANLSGGAALARVDATVRWQGDVGQEDTVRVAVQGPGDRSASAEGSGGSVAAEATVQAEPDATTVSARSPEDAEQQAASTLDASQGLGTWTVEVELTDAPGEADDGNPVTTEQGDGYQEHTLTVAWHVWTASVSG